MALKETNAGGGGNVEGHRTIVVSTNGANLLLPDGHDLVIRNRGGHASAYLVGPGGGAEGLNDIPLTVGVGGEGGFSFYCSGGAGGGAGGPHAGTDGVTHYK